MDTIKILDEDEEQKIIEFIKSNRGERIMLHSPFDDTLKEVVRVSTKRSEYDKDDDRWEPGPCVDFTDGTYAIMDDIELKDFWIMTNALDIGGEV